MEAAQSAVNADRGDSAREERGLAKNPWWYASFVFPVVAGTFGPIAAAFSICAAVRPWALVESPQDAKDVEPRRLLAANAVQVAVALVSNVMLLLGLARRVKRSITEPITIVGWYLSSFCLAALVVAAPHLTALPDSEYEWSQAYYYCIYAAVVYFIVASLMLLNFLGARFSHHDHDLVMSATLRTLMLNSIAFLALLLLGALVFSRIEGWAYLDAVYWADVTLMTIGFGDISPSTTLGRALLFPYAVFGIICLGLVLVSIRRLVLDRGKLMLNSKRLGRMRNEYLRRASSSGMLAERDSQLSQTVFNELREIQLRAARHRRWTAVAISLGVWLSLLFGGGAIFAACERPYQSWSYFDGVYMAFVALTTIGFGDLAPASSSGRSFFVLWSLMAVPAVTILISDAEDTLLKALRDAVVFLGKVTILPSEAGFRREAKDMLRRLGFGKSSNGTDNWEPRQVPFEPSTSKTQPKDISTRRKYHVVLLDEIVGVIHHLKEEQPQIYSFDQCVWYSKLLRGYRNTTDTHRDGHQEHCECSRPRRPADAGRISPSQALGGSSGQHGTLRFAEFGISSPLMGPREEAEWMLGRLTETLRRELGDMVKQEEAGGGDRHFFAV